MTELFPPVATETWMAAIEADLKGADFEKKLVKTTLDGVRLRPFYRAEDLPSELPELTDRPRLATLREEIREPNLQDARSHALTALGSGAEELAVLTYPFGPEIRTQDDLRALLDGIFLEMAPIHWLCGPLAAPFLAMVASEVDRRGLDRASIRGSVDLDPILDRCAGWTEAPMEDWATEFLRTSGWIMEALPAYRVLTIRGGLIEKAGASLAQEMAFSLALLAEYLHAWTSAGRAADELLQRTEIRVGVGTNLLLEIAKLRAMVPMLRTLAGVYGGTLVPHLHAVTTSSNKTLYDPYNNLLRATLEGVGAVLGGCDSLSIAAYDQGYDTPDEFSAHLSRNTRTLLAEEARLLAVRDPLAGSYTVERLTHDYADAGWAILREVELQGGFVAAWQRGWVGAQLESVQAKRMEQVRTRRRVIVGTTLYANPFERRLADVQSRPPVMQVVPAAEPEIDAIRRAFENGATLEYWLGREPVPSTPLNPFRPSWPYEHLRLRLERHGEWPTVLLAKLGDPAMAAARAGFCSGFFATGGIAAVEESFTDGGAARARAAELNADLLVLCSADAEYAGHVAAAAVSKPCPLIVAGYPADQIEALKVGGADDFVHLRLDALATLHEWFKTWGIPEVTA